MAILYWIHSPDHTNPKTQGYIGVTTRSLNKRMSGHMHMLRKGCKNTLYNAMRKHPDFKVTILAEDDSEFCNLLEWAYRSKPNIAWNICAGGESRNEGRKLSKEAVEKLRVINTGKKMSADAIQKSASKRTGRKVAEEHLARMRVIGKAVMTFENPWEHPHSNKYCWSLALDIYAKFSKGEVIGRRSVAKEFGITPDSAMKVVNKIKSGWNPSEDNCYSVWLDNYKEASCQNIAS